jgi:hypothetical protein
MHVQELLAQARDVITIKRVFGEPIEKNGMTAPLGRLRQAHR